MSFRHGEEREARRGNPALSGLLRCARNDAISCLLLAAVVLNLSACGHKGRLKTPMQMEQEEAKKARKAAKEGAPAVQEQEQDEGWWTIFN